MLFDVVFFKIVHVLFSVIGNSCLGMECTPMSACIPNAKREA